MQIAKANKLVRVTYNTATEGHAIICSFICLWKFAGYPGVVLWSTKLVRFVAWVFVTRKKWRRGEWGKKKKRYFSNYNHLGFVWNYYIKNGKLEKEEMREIMTKKKKWEIKREDKFFYFFIIFLYIKNNFYYIYMHQLNFESSIVTKL